MPHTYDKFISPIGATGQHNAMNAFAYMYAGKLCRIISKVWVDSTEFVGYRYTVEMEDKGRGTLWEDEVSTWCENCGTCWMCDV